PSAQDADFVAPLGVPEAHAAVLRARGEGPAVRTECTAEDGCIMPAEHGGFLRGLRVPQMSGRCIRPPGGETFAVRTQQHLPPTRTGSGDHGSGVVELAMEVSPFPVAMLRGRILEGTLTGLQVVDLEGAGCRRDVGAIPLPAFLGADVFGFLPG